MGPVCARLCPQHFIFTIISFSAIQESEDFRSNKSHQLNTFYIIFYSFQLLLFGPAVKCVSSSCKTAENIFAHQKMEMKTVENEILSQKMKSLWNKMLQKDYRKQFSASWVWIFLLQKLQKMLSPHKMKSAENVNEEQHKTIIPWKLFSFFTENTPSEMLETKIMKI